MEYCVENHIQKHNYKFFITTTKYQQQNAYPGYCNVMGPYPKNLCTESYCRRKNSTATCVFFDSLDSMKEGNGCQKKKAARIRKSEFL